MTKRHGMSAAVFVAGCVLLGVILSALTHRRNSSLLQLELDGSAIRYSEFRTKVVEGSVADVVVQPEKITGQFKSGARFSTVPIPNDDTLPKLLRDNGVPFKVTAAD